MCACVLVRVRVQIIYYIDVYPSEIPTDMKINLRALVISAQHPTSHLMHRCFGYPFCVLCMLASSASALNYNLNLITTK